MTFDDFIATKKPVRTGASQSDGYRYLDAYTIAVTNGDGGRWSLILRNAEFRDDSLRALESMLWNWIQDQ